jgi:hypothetical protein
VLTIAVVAFERGRIRSQRLLRDHATLTAQLDLPGLARPGQRRGFIKAPGPLLLA